MTTNAAVAGTATTAPTGPVPTRAAAGHVAFDGRRWPALTGRGRVGLILALSTAGAAWLTGDGNAYLAAACLLAPIVTDFVFQLGGLPQLVIRVGRRRTVAGGAFVERFEIANVDGGRSLVDARLVEPRTTTWSGGLHLAELAPGETLRVELPGRVRRRGHHRTRSFDVETRFPLGFVERRGRLVLEAELIAEPARVRLPAAVLRALGEEPRHHAQDRREGGLEFWSLREHQLDEDIRGVHALRSATLGTPVRRQLRGRSSRSIRILIDLRRPPGRSARRGSRRLEWSLGAAAALIDRLRQEGTAMHCIAIDTGVRHFEIPVGGDTQPVLTYLAGARPVEHHVLDDAALGDDAGSRSFWVPAGGYRATDDRRRIGDPVLISEEPWA